MGYLTQFSLDVEPVEYNIIKELKTFSEGADCAITEYGDARQSCKWYDHMRDMKKFSKKYPNTLFILYGQGGGEENNWKAHFKEGKGKKVFAELHYPPIEPKDLV